MPKSKASVVQGYVIDPTARTITPGPIDTSPESLQRIVGGETVPLFRWENDVVIVLNKDGVPNRPDFSWGGLRDFWGTAVVVGLRRDEYRDVELDAAELASWIEWPAVDA